MADFSNYTDMANYIKKRYGDGGIKNVILRGHGGGTQNGGGRIKFKNSEGYKSPTNLGGGFDYLISTLSKNMVNYDNEVGNIVVTACHGTFIRSSFGSLSSVIKNNAKSNEVWVSDGNFATLLKGNGRSFFSDYFYSTTPSGVRVYTPFYNTRNVGFASRRSYSNQLRISPNGTLIFSEYQFNNFGKFK